MKLLIMLVDDDQDDRFFFALAVKESGGGYEVIETESGENALRLLSNSARLPDYIFIDLNMPAMNGKECLKELKKDAALKNIPVIIYTTSVSPKDIKEVYELGAAYYFKKPMDTASLGVKIVDAVESVREKMNSTFK